MHSPKLFPYIACSTKQSICGDTRMEIRINQMVLKHLVTMLSESIKFVL